MYELLKTINDPADLRRKIGPHSRAVLLVHMSGAPGAVDEIAAICRERGALLIVDEILTGFGRTGTMFAVEQEGVGEEQRAHTGARGRSGAAAARPVAVRGRARIDRSFSAQARVPRMASSEAAQATRARAASRGSTWSAPWPGDPCRCRQRSSRGRSRSSVATGPDYSSRERFFTRLNATASASKSGTSTCTNPPGFSTECQWRSTAGASFMPTCSSTWTLRISSTESGG